MDGHELFTEESICDGIDIFQMKDLFNIICLKFRKEMNDICYQDCLPNGDNFDARFEEIMCDRTVCDKVFDNLRKELRQYVILYSRAEKYLKDFREIRLSGEDAVGLYEWKSFQEYVDTELGVTLEKLGPYDYTKFVKNMRESASFANGMRIKYTKWLTECMVKNSIISSINRLVV
jgi:hypothetical protein